MISDRLLFSSMSVIYWLVLSYGRVTRYIVYTEEGERVMDTWFSMGAVTPFIQFCRVISSRMVMPYCSQSFLTFYDILSAVCLGWYLRPIVFPQCYAVNIIRSI